MFIPDMVSFKKYFYALLFEIFKRVFCTNKTIYSTKIII